MPFKISILINPIEFKYPLFDCLRNMDGNKKITANPIPNVPIVKYNLTFFSIELVTVSYTHLTLPTILRV